MTGNITLYAKWTRNYTPRPYTPPTVVIPDDALGLNTTDHFAYIIVYGNGEVRPNAAITRAEFAAIAARFDNDGDKTAAKFSDIATHWAKDEISIAYNNG